VSNVNKLKGKLSMIDNNVRKNRDRQNCEISVKENKMQQIENVKRQNRMQL